MLEQVNVEIIRKKLHQRRETHQKELSQELERITSAAIELGVQKIILFGSAAWGNSGLISDLGTGSSLFAHHLGYTSRFLIAHYRAL